MHGDADSDKPDDAQAAAVTVVGIDGSNGKDVITTTDPLAVDVSAGAATPEVTAIGVDAGNGKDVITTVEPLTVNVSVDAANAEATAIGVVGGNGKDTLHNDGGLTVAATSTWDTGPISFTLTGNDETDVSTTIVSSALGIDGGNGKDEVINAGTITAEAVSHVDVGSIQANLTDTAHGDTSIDSTSTAVGISGGRGKDGDDIANTGTVEVHATSGVDSTTVEVNLAEAALADASVGVTASATGIETGQANDHITNSGTVTATATATSSSVDVNVSYLDITHFADRGGGNASTELMAEVTGISTGQGKDDISIADTGTVTAAATSTAHSTGVSVASEGVPSTVIPFVEGTLADAGITSTAAATGIDAGAGNDHVTNMGIVTANATSSAAQESVNVGVAVLDFKVPTPGVVIGGAGTVSNSAATGIAAGDGNDEVLNEGLLDVDATSTGSATTVSANIAELSADLLEGVPGVPFGASLVVADASQTASARAAGIEGERGNDSLANTGTVDVDATAESGSVSVGASIDVKYKEGDNWFHAGAVLARAETRAESSAVGIDAGEGKDEILNAGDLFVDARSDTTTVVASVDVAGTLQGKGGSLGGTATDTSSMAISEATGIDGGDGRDEIVNTDMVKVDATSDVLTVNGSLEITVAKEGLAAGVALTRSGTTAEAYATGIAGGEDGDEIVNDGHLDVGALSDVTSVGVTLTVDGTMKGAGLGVAMADTSTTAIAEATGIEGGAGDDEIVNLGLTEVDATSKIHAANVAVDVTVAEKGVAAGAALARSETRAESYATGIVDEDDRKATTNAGTLNVTALSDIDAATVGVDVSGTVKGVGAGAALTDTSATAVAQATGIKRGVTDDEVANLGDITVGASTDANATSVSAGIGAGSQGVTAEAALARAVNTSEASATGIDAGEGGDKIVNTETGTITVGSNPDGTKAVAKADAASVSGTIAAEMKGVAAGVSITDASTGATADSTGIEAGGGDDEIGNAGEITVNAWADSDATSVAGTIGVAEKGVVMDAALAKATNEARVLATGIDGGEGDDTIVNTGQITVGSDPDSDEVMSNADAISVGVSVAGAVYGASLTAALTDTSTTATADTKGIAGGAGDDEVLNAGEVTVYSSTYADTTSASASFGVVGGGVAADAALARATATSEACAAGIDGGEGADLVCSEGEIEVKVDAGATSEAIGVSVAGAAGGAALGAALTDGSADATADADGIAGGAGADSLTNTDKITADASSKAETVSVSVDIKVTGTGAAAGAALSRTKATSNAYATGIDGGEGADLIGSEGEIHAKGVSDADATSVSVTLDGSMQGVAAGAAVTDSSATGFTDAKGIDGGDDADVILSASNITADSESYADALGVSVSGVATVGLAAGAALSNSSATAEAHSTGIDGGRGNDWITNAGQIAATSTADASGKSTSIGVAVGISAGVTVSDSSVQAISVAEGIDTGIGDDVLVNSGDITSTATCTADSGSVSVTVSSVGVALGDASTTSSAKAAGIESGLGNDLIWNEGSITVSLGSDLGADAKSINIGAGWSDAQALVRAETIGVGIASGGEDDEIVNTGNITIGPGADGDEWMSKVEAGSFALNIAGAADATSSLDAVTTSTGIDAGDGDDQLRNEGMLDIAATSYASASSGSIQIFGSSDAGGTVTAKTIATGIDGGEGDDLIANFSEINVGSTATLSFDGSSFEFGGTGEAEATLEASTHSAGITGGADADQIYNEGDVYVDATSTLDSKGDSDTAFGTSEAGATSGAVTEAIGIDGGEGDDLIENSATITVGSTAKLTLDNSSFDFGGTGEAGATLEASTHSAGITGGADADQIYNEGDVCVDATSTLDSKGDSDTAFGTSEAAATSGAVTEAIGIDGGEGDDLIENSATITVGSTAKLTLDNSSFDFGGTGEAGGTLEASTHSAGIAGGAGADQIRNEGDIYVDATSTLVSEGGSDTAFGTSDTAATSGAVTEAIGIDGGEGDDLIVNFSTIEVGSTADLTVDGSSYTFGGTGEAGAELTAATHSVGIAGGADADRIWNEGDLAVDASSTLDSKGDVETTFGTSEDGAIVSTDTNATGIDGDEGNDVIANVASITVSTDSTVDSSNASYVFGGISEAGAVVEAFSRSTGLAGGEGDDQLYNEGEISVDTSASLTNSGNSYAEFGGAVTGGLVTAEAESIGIGGGDANDLAMNRGTITVTGSTCADSHHTTDTGFLFGGGDSAARASVGLKGYGIDVGAGDNEVANEGTISIALYAKADTSASSDGADIADGDAVSTSESTSSATGVGILAGHGDNVITNDGTITVQTSYDGKTLKSKANAWADGDGIDGDGKATAKATTNAWVAGIAVGDGSNDITNNGTITVDTQAEAEAHADADSDAGGSTSITEVARVDISAYGIKTGNGDSRVTNDGTIDVTASAETVGLGEITVEAVGIDAGDGHDVVINYGTIDMTGTADAYVGEAWDLGLGEWFISGPATAESTVIGMKTGDGHDAVDNQGTITVSSDSDASADSFDYDEVLSWGMKTANARAVGIDAGDGDNLVINSGAIDVTAAATAGTQLVWDAAANPDAIGILTGSGDDIIINSGTITAWNEATTAAGTSSWLGTAIDSGGGDDWVVLEDESVMEGNIDLGMGDDGLLVIGSASVAGEADGGEGTDALVLDGATNFDAAQTENFESMVHQGAGTGTVANAQTVQELHVIEGALQIQGDYELADDGTVSTLVYGDGTCGQLVIDDTVGLGGTLSVIRGAGAYLDGTTYTVFQAGGIESGSQFDDVALPDATPLLSFDAVQEDNAYEVHANAASFTTVSTNGVELAIAEHLDTILPSVTGDLSNVIGEFQASSWSDYGAAFASLSPDSYDDATRKTLDVTRQFTRRLRGRLHSIRSALAASGDSEAAASAALPLSAFDGTRIRGTSLFGAGETGYAQGQCGWWLDASGEWGEQDGDEACAGSDYRTRGTTLGFDRAFSGKLIGGVSLDCARIATDIDGIGADGLVRGMGGSAYSCYYSDPWYVEGALSYARHRYDSSRAMRIGDVERTADSHHDGRAFSGYVGAGHMGRYKSWAMGPFVSLDLVHLSEEGFQESGADSVSLVVESRTTRSLVSELGVRAGRFDRTSRGLLMRELSLAWNHEFDTDDRGITAAFVGAPDTLFTVNGQAHDDDWLTVSAGLTLADQKGRQVSVSYGGEFGEDRTAHGVFAAVSSAF